MGRGLADRRPPPAGRAFPERPRQAPQDVTATDQPTGIARLRRPLAQHPPPCRRRPACPSPHRIRRAKIERWYAGGQIELIQTYGIQTSMSKIPDDLRRLAK